MCYYMFTKDDGLEWAYVHTYGSSFYTIDTPLSMGFSFYSRNFFGNFVSFRLCV